MKLSDIELEIEACDDCVSNGEIDIIDKVKAFSDWCYKTHNPSKADYDEWLSEIQEMVDRRENCRLKAEKLRNAEFKMVSE